MGTRTGSVVPTGYEAYARVFHPVEVGENEWMRWADVAARTGRRAHSGMQWETITFPSEHRSGAGLSDPLEGSLPQWQTRALTEILRHHTSTGDGCWMAAWEGYGDVPRPAMPRLQLPDRDYVLLKGGLDAAARPLWRFMERGWDHYQSPNLWWPHDRAWVVGTEVDFPWTYVAGSSDCVEAVIRDERLEAYEVAVDDRADILGDDINPLPPLRPRG